MSENVSSDTYKSYTLNIIWEVSKDTAVMCIGEKNTILRKQKKKNNNKEVLLILS